MSHSTLLTVDAVINLALGVLLAVFPGRLVAALGIPSAAVAFYPGILGAVLFGIGIALLIERVRGESGLGLAGANSINLCGGAAVAGWLLFGSLSVPARGRVLLRVLVVLLFVLSSIELAARARRSRERSP